MKYYFKVLANYVNFNGRARRSEYWYFVLFNVIISFILGFTIGILQLPDFSFIYTVGIILPSIAVGVRRMHDVGKSGWYLLIPIYSIILLCTNGEAGENMYGPNPKGE
jgi:uncharacterized membrane protein YhaH (DUF805 family)